MALNPEAVGRETDPVEITWTSKDALLYAVGVGAGTDELAFTTENSEGITQQVLPTFALVAGSGARPSPSTGSSIFGLIGDFDMTMLVHGAQAVTLNAPLPPEGSALVRNKVVAMHDKGKAAVVVTEATAESGGTLLYSTRSSLFIRGAGGWGGERGPSGPQNEPPEREPDQQVSYRTSPDQALVYRLSGDRNPLHSDPSFAKRAGFERPILHGLCTYGFTGRALLHAVCGSDPTRFHHIEGRFASPVYPGDELTIRAWTVGDGQTVFTTSVGDRVVIDQGLLRHS